LPGFIIPFLGVALLLMILATSLAICIALKSLALGSPCSMSTDVLEELEELFEWNTPVLQYAVGCGKSEYDLRKARQVAFYDMHLAPSRTCKRVVHVPYLHKKIARIIDTKMQQICDGTITLPPTNTGNFRDAGDREEQVNRNCNPLTNARSVVDYYSVVTSECFLPIASALTFHPKFWRNIITWSVQPRCIALGSYGASLHIIQMDKGARTHGCGGAEKAGEDGGQTG
jgi:hypothetical protein